MMLLVAFALVLTAEVLKVTQSDKAHVYGCGQVEMKGRWFGRRVLCPGTKSVSFKG